MRHQNKNRKNHSIKNEICNQLQEYGSQSSIHGVSYILNCRLSIFERLFWVIILLGVGFAAKILIVKSFYSWQDNLVITGLKDIDKSIAGMNFPSVTICPNGLHLNFVEENLIKNYKDWKPSGNRDLTESEELYFVNKYLSETFQIMNDTKINIIDILDSLAALNEQSLTSKMVMKNALACSHKMDEDASHDSKCKSSLKSENCNALTSKRDS